MSYSDQKFSTWGGWAMLHQLLLCLEIVADRKSNKTFENPPPHRKLRPVSGRNDIDGRWVGSIDWFTLRPRF